MSGVRSDEYYYNYLWVINFCYYCNYFHTLVTMVVRTRPARDKKARKGGDYEAAGPGGVSFPGWAEPGRWYRDTRRYLPQPAGVLSCISPAPTHTTHLYSVISWCSQPPRTLLVLVTPLSSSKSGVQQQQDICRKEWWWSGVKLWDEWVQRVPDHYTRHLVHELWKDNKCCTVTSVSPMPIQSSKSESCVFT